MTKKLRNTEPGDFKPIKAQLDCFEKLKIKLTSPSLLTLPTSDQPLRVETDTKTDKLGRVILKERDEKSIRPVGYFSKTLTNTERKYDRAKGNTSP